MIRPAGPQDVPFMRDILRHAYYWRVDRVSESGEPPVRRYVERFAAVLNPPQAAIVPVGATEDRAVAHDGELAIRPTMTVTGTFDHRAVDGAPAADFLQTVKELLEEPGLML